MKKGHCWAYSVVQALVSYTRKLMQFDCRKYMHRKRDNHNHRVTSSPQGTTFCIKSERNLNKLRLFYAP